MLKLSRQTQKVYDRIKDGGWISQEECFAEKITYRLSNKVRELEKKGFTIDRKPVAEGRRDLMYRIAKWPEEITAKEFSDELWSPLAKRIKAENKLRLL